MKRIGIGCGTVINALENTALGSIRAQQISEESSLSKVTVAKVG